VVTTDQALQIETEVNRSKFIAHLVPMAEFSGVQEQLKRAHPKANHVVYAYRHLNARDQIVENSSDDGEPRGAAGIPILNVMRGKDLINCAVVIIRYFGGVKLGIGGMVRAYTLAAQNLINEVDWHPYFKQITYVFETSYQDIQRTEYRLAQLEIKQIERTFEVGSVQWSITGSEHQVHQIQALF
jgi:uncharacterized YigZ family protein